MPGRIEVAREHADRFEFEVCPGPPGLCPHDDPEADHRRYTWGKPVGPMTADDMVREIGLLEDLVQATPGPGVPLPQEGRPF